MQLTQTHNTHTPTAHHTEWKRYYNTIQRRRRRFPISIRFFLSFFVSHSQSHQTFISLCTSASRLLFHPHISRQCLVAHNFMAKYYYSAVRVHASDQSIWHKHTDLFPFEVISFSLFGLSVQCFSFSFCSRMIAAAASISQCAKEATQTIRIRTRLFEQRFFLSNFK